jgi:tRNA (guanosine-2'-O-)-methyltransferase
VIGEETMRERLAPDEVDAFLKGRDALSIAAKLEALVSDARRSRIEQVLSGRHRRLVVGLEEPYDPHNAAAVVRSAEAFGAGAVHVIAASERILRSKRSTTGTHRWVRTRSHRDLAACMRELKGEGMTVAGACVDATCTLEELPADRPLCLLFGNENRGLSDAAKAVCDLHYRIPMHGFAESLNLSVSAAISLYVTLGRRRAHLGRGSDLSDAEIAQERARWYLNSVDGRTIQGLAERGEI